MPAVYINLAEHDATTGHNTLSQYGPASIGAGNTITRIAAQGAISVPIIATTSGITLNSWLQYGFQHGALGYSPTSPESITTPGSEWLRFQAVQTPGHTAATLSGSPGSDYMSDFPVNLEWLGQLRTPNGTDLYFSVGRFFNPGINYYFQGCFVVTYA